MPVGPLAPNTPSTRHRFVVLDALRGVVALLVVAWHIPSFPGGERRFPNGFLAVDFFFCLSGFVIAFAYERRLEEGMRLWDFAVARLIRLYPLYFLGLAFGVASSLLFAHAASDVRASPLSAAIVLVLGVGLIPNLMVHWPLSYSFPLNGPSWSLFYELAANFAFAGLTVFIRARKAVLVVICLLSLGGLLLGLSKLAGVSVGTYPDTFLLGFARVGLSFFAGVIVLRLYRHADSPRFSGVSGRIVPIMTVVGVAFPLLATLALAQTWAFQICCLVLIFPCAVYVGACSQLPHRYDRPCGLLGDLSYPIYILHFPLIFAFTGRKAHIFFGHHQALSAVVLPASYLAVFGIAFCANEFYDKPLRKWLTRHYNELRQVNSDESAVTLMEHR